MNTDAEEFKLIFEKVLNEGVIVEPRGLKVLEIENMRYTLNPYVRFCNFDVRKLNLRYIKQEFMWYLHGDKYDTSITEHASLWKTLINSDGSINSNYGQYLKPQLPNVIEILKKDKDSRRASIMILNSTHLLSDTNDFPCTYALNFRIRDNKLNMTVHMRSQDAIFGMGNDAPTFSFVQELVLMSLKDKYPELKMGTYTHFADSFHVYERHFEMLKKLLSKETTYFPVECPKISSSDEVNFLLTEALRSIEYSKIPAEYQFTKWLCSNE